MNFGLFYYCQGLVCSFGHLSHAPVCRSLALFAQAVIQPRQAVAPASTASPEG